MDVIEIPSHFMENFVHDARTLPLFAPDASQRAEAIAEQVIRDRHMFGALDLETQARDVVMQLSFVYTATCPYNDCFGHQKIGPASHCPHSKIPSSQLGSNVHCLYRQHPYIKWENHYTASHALFTMSCATSPFTGALCHNVSTCRLMHMHKLQCDCCTV